MKINEQYHNLNLLENVTYEFLGRDGETHEETEPILVEHMMDVYVNERLTMKLVCIPQHLTELVLGRLFTEGIISSADDVDQIYICEFGKRARVILSKNKSGQSHEENEDYVAPTPTCCTGNRVLNDYFITDQPMTPVTPVPWKKQWIFDLADCFQWTYPYRYGDQGNPRRDPGSGKQGIPFRRSSCHGRRIPPYPYLCRAT